MNKLLIALAILGYCAALNIYCKDNQRNVKFCTREYSPVCGIQISSKNKYSQQKKTFANACTACANPVIKFYSVGECKNYPSNSVFCLPDDNQIKACTRESKPVCGLQDHMIACDNAPCGSNFSNKCLACSSSQTTHFVKGVCIQHD